MRRCLVIVLVTLSLALKTGLSQNPFEPDTHIGCVERLEAPAYSAVARQVKAEGTITASVVLTQSASIHEITTEFKSKTRRAIGLLIPLVEKSIVEAAFRPTCAGETVVLIFDFKIAGQPSDSPKQSVSFGYPNKFWIVTEPVRLVMDTRKAK
jgi:hypothetical protein